MKRKIGIALAAGVLAAGLPGAALAAPAADTEGTVTAYLRDQPDFHAAAERAVSEFAEIYPNATVEVQYVPQASGWGSYIDGLFNQIAAGDTPSIVDLPIEGFLAVSSKDLLVDLRPVLDSADDGSLDDIAEGLLTQMQSPLTGELNYYPTDWNNILIHYNKDMFDEAGLPYPEDGWTWAEFAETAKALTKADADGNVIQYGYRIPGFNFGITPWFLSNGTDKLDATWTESTVTDPAFAETMEFLRGLIDDGAAPTFSGGVGDQEFAAGQAAMFSCGHWCVPGYEAAGIENVGVVMPPVPNEGDDLVTVFGIGGIGVFQDAADVDLAVEFAKVFAGEDFQKTSSESRVSIPASRTWATTEEFLAYPDNAELFYGTADNDQLLPIASPPNFTQVEGIFMRHVENYLTGNADLDSTIADMDSELSRAMERAYR